MLDRLSFDFNISTIERLAAANDTIVWQIGPEGPDLRRKAQEILAERNRPAATAPAVEAKPAAPAKPVAPAKPKAAGKR